jgi:hypothetical protein
MPRQDYGLLHELNKTAQSGLITSQAASHHMNRTDILILLVPAVMFVLVAFGVIETWGMFHRSLASYDYQQQKAEALIRNVQSGKWHLTTEEWIGAIKVSQKVTEADRGITEADAEAVRVFGWCALIGIGLQINAILHVRKKFKKMLPNTAL